METAVTNPGETLETLKIVAGGGAALSVIVVVGYFLRFLSQERKGRTAERALERADFKASIDKVVASHSEGLDRVLNANTEALNRVVESNERSLRGVSDGLVEVKKHTVAVEGKVDALREHIKSSRARSRRKVR